jgi:hypothetical protein
VRNDATDTARLAARGLTPTEVARMLRVRPDRVRAWIASGDLAAVNTAPHRCGRPRYVVLPHQLDDFTRRRAAAVPTRVTRRRTRTCLVDYFADGAADKMDTPNQIP